MSTVVLAGKRYSCPPRPFNPASGETLLLLTYGVLHKSQSRIGAFSALATLVRRDLQK
jgi:hypothetical protein